MNKFSTGAVPPQDFAWQMGKSAEIVSLVGRIERITTGLDESYRRNLDKIVERLKSGERLDISLEACARASHEANRAYCIATGDFSQERWENAPDWQRKSAETGVFGVITGNSPRQSHESWLAEKLSDGWKYGPVKNVELKEHPCFVPYDRLDATQRMKDEIFVAVVGTMALALGLK